MRSIVRPLGMIGWMLGLGAAAAAADGGLIGHWPMDEGQGHLIRDAAGQAGDGEQIGAEWVPLKTGTCLKLGAPFEAGLMDRIEGRPRPNTPGSAFRTLASPQAGYAYARIPMNALCELGRKGGMRHKTMSFWAKPINGGLVNPGEGGQAFVLAGGGYIISISGSHWQARVVSSYKDGSTAIGGTAVESDAWAHLVLMNDQAFARFYVNGREVGREQGPYLITNLAFPSSPKASPAIHLSVGLGERGRLPPAYVGYVDDLKIYNRTLSAEDVLAEYEAGRAVHAD